MKLFANGDRFEGSIESDLQSGNGQFIFNDHSQYQGSFQNCLFHGEGTLTISNCQFQGYWNQGKPDTTTQWIIKDQHYIYTGSIDQDFRKNGSGEIHFNKDNYYKGFWKNDNFHGMGELKTKQLEYKGLFFNNQFHGQGQLKANSYTYIGDFELGYMNGIGTLEQKGYIYKGEFKNNQKQGQGQIIIDGQDTYEGQWYDDEPNGEGTLIQNNPFFGKLIYKGRFNQGLPEGQGSLKIGEKDEFIGQFRNGQFQGKGLYINGNAKIEGEFFENKINGEVNITFLDSNQKMNCYIQANKKNGFCQLIVKNMKYEGYFNKNLEDYDQSTYKTIKIE